MKIFPLPLIIFSYLLGGLAFAQEAKPPDNSVTPTTTTESTPTTSDLARINALSEEIALKRQVLNQAVNELNQKQEQLQQSAR